ncbi:MAG: osmotically inducible protein OsmC [Pseudonocardiales bacterium]|nr:MAG: osmotically inducible protein OsmC [Pseudonocardiales bacterium]
MARMHRYESHLVWQGSTGVGYAGYPREHRVLTPPSGTELRLSADPAFRGDPALPNPEQLLLAAASSCQLLSFLALAALAGVDVVAYEDDAEAVMPEDQTPVRITRIVLRPQIVVAAGVDIDQVRQLVSQAHDTCYVANTLNAEVVIEPAIEHAAHIPAGTVRS